MIWNKICSIFIKLKLFTVSAIINLFKKSEKPKNMQKSAEIRSAIVRIVNKIDTTDGKVKLIKVDGRYFRVRELG